MKAKFSLVALLAIALAALVLVGCTTSTAPSSSAQLPYIPIDQVPATVGPNPLPRSIGQYSFIGYTDGVLSNSRFFAVLAYDGQTMFLADINLFHNIITAVRIRGLTSEQFAAVQKTLQSHQTQMGVLGRLSTEVGDIVWTVGNDSEVAEISLIAKQVLQSMPPTGPISVPTVLPKKVAPIVAPALAMDQADDGLIVFIVCGDGRCDPIFPQTAMTGPMDLSRVRVIRRIGGAVPQDLPQILAGFEKEAGIPVKTIFVSTHGTFANGMCVGCGGQGGLTALLDDPLGAGAKIPAEVANWLPANLISADVLEQVNAEVNDVARMRPGVEVVGMVQSSDTWFYRVRYHGFTGAELRVTPQEWQVAAKANWVSVPQIKWTAQVQPSQNVQEFFARMGVNEGAARSAAQAANFAGGQSFRRIVVDATGMPLQAIDPALFAGADPAFVISAFNPGDAAAQLPYAWARVKSSTQVYIIVPKAPTSTAAAVIDALDKSQSFGTLIGDAKWQGKVTLLTVDGGQIVSRAVLRDSGQVLSQISLVGGGSGNPLVPAEVKEPPIQYKVMPQFFVAGQVKVGLQRYDPTQLEFGWFEPGAKRIPLYIVADGTDRILLLRQGMSVTPELLQSLGVPMPSPSNAEKILGTMKGIGGTVVRVGSYALVGVIAWDEFSDKLGLGPEVAIIDQLEQYFPSQDQNIITAMVGAGLEKSPFFWKMQGKNLYARQVQMEQRQGKEFMLTLANTNHMRIPLMGFLNSDDIPTGIIVNYAKTQGLPVLIYSNVATGESVTWVFTSQGWIKVGNGLDKMSFKAMIPSSTGTYVGDFELSWFQERRNDVGWTFTEIVTPKPIQTWK